MASTPIYNWPTPDNTGLVKNGALDMRTLGNAIDTTMGTMVPKTIVDAKGDLIAGTAADTPARLAVGTNGQVLTADSTAATGLKWATASSGAQQPILTFVTPVNNFSTSSSSFVDMTDYTITRTPVSGTNKIEIKANLFFYNTTSQTIGFRGFQGATALGERESVYGTGFFYVTLIFYVTNNAASSTTFKLQTKGTGATNITFYGSNSGYNNNFSVLEVY